MKTATLFAALGLGLGMGMMALPAVAGEIPLGEPIDINGIRLGAVYLQAVTMESGHESHAAHGAVHPDIHLEADIHALKDNPNGFREDSWVPYLDVRFRLTKVGSAFVVEEPMVPMVANDGPHYGLNVKMDGPGKYHLVVFVAPPGEGFARHTDKETGVGAWWKPFSYEYDFTYVGGVGKKGGY